MVELKTIYNPDHYLFKRQSSTRGNMEPIAPPLKPYPVKEWALFILALSIILGVAFWR